MAKITITRRGVARSYTVPDSLSDVSVADMKKAGMQALRAVTVASHAIELYTFGKADLGYGLTATIKGHIDAPVPEEPVTLDTVIQKLYERTKTIRFARGYAAANETIRTELEDAARLTMMALDLVRQKMLTRELPSEYRNSRYPLTVDYAALLEEPPTADYRLQGAPKTREQAEALVADIQREPPTDA